MGGVLGDVGARQDGKDPGAEFWVDLEAKLCAVADELEPQGVANVLWGLAALEHRASPRLRDALEAAAVKHCRFASKEGGRDAKRGPVRAPPRRTTDDGRTRASLRGSSLTSSR